MAHVAKIYRLGIKELWSLARDPIMLGLIAYVFTLSIYVAATALPETLHKAPISIVDEDASPLSALIISAFFMPQFKPPSIIPLKSIDRGLDSGIYTFALDIPPDFQRDVLAGRSPTIQLNVDATHMLQAFTGSGYVQQIVMGEVGDFVRHYHSSASPAVDLAVRARYNPNLQQFWFGGIMEILNNVTILSVILTGAALIRESEHGTIEHLLAMPVTPGEIMVAKVWSMGLVVLLAAAVALLLVARGVLQIPVEGSIALFLTGAALHLFATTSLGIFMATLARSMPKFGILLILVLLPMQLLSGSVTPRESMPEFAQGVMLMAPTTHFVSLGEAILFRGAGLDVVWPQFLELSVIGAVFFAVSLKRFRQTISQMA